MSYKRSIHFPKLYFRAKYIVLHKQKIKVKNFTVVVTLLNFLILFTFHFSLFSTSFLYLLSCENFFMSLASFCYPFSFLRRTLYNTWKSHYIQLKAFIMILNKKALVNICSISNSKNSQRNLLSFVSEMVVHECLKSSVWNCFSFALIWNYWEIYKNTWFSQ